MATEPTAKTTIIADAIANLYFQFQGAPIVNAIVASYAAEAQEIETMLVSLWTDLMLPNAVGVQLDRIGRIVGEPRLGRSDGSYRTALYARILVNKSNGTIPDILGVLKAATEQVRTFDIRDYGECSLTIRLIDALGSLDGEVLNALVQEIKGAGIRADFITSSEDDTATFRCASGDTIETSSLIGVANDAGTTGGVLAKVY